MSSVMPSLKKVWSGELQRFSNGNTAINVRADAEDIDGAAIWRIPRMPDVNGSDDILEGYLACVQ